MLRKCCGTCAFGKFLCLNRKGKPKTGSSGQCKYEVKWPKLPYIIAKDSILRFSTTRYVMPSDGEECATWKEKV